MSFTNPSDDALRRIIEGARTIAVVGASGQPDRTSYGVMRYLLDAGYNVVPVNPNETEILGRRAVPNLAAIDAPIDIVDVFQRPEDAPSVADAAVAAGARVLWMQLGVSSREAATRAAAAGLTVVMGKCIRTAHRTLGIHLR